jgi:hypothetical protein
MLRHSSLYGDRRFLAIGRGAQAVAWLALFGSMMAAPALAKDPPSCPGTITATSLNPIKPASALEFRVQNRSKENLALADGFADGMREAGATVSKDGPLILDVTFLVTEAAPGPTAASTLHADFTWMKNLGSPVGTQRPTLKLTASLLKKEGVESMWIATVDCTVATLDSHLLAHDLGVLVAVHFGESVTSKSFQ